MLSGGMKQRVAIARALAMKPTVLLMDEPFAALDALTRRKMQDELIQLWDESRFTVIFVTHSIEEALIVGWRILVLSPHPGQVRAELNADHSASAKPARRFRDAAPPHPRSLVRRQNRNRARRRTDNGDTANASSQEPPRRPERMVELDTMGAIGDVARPLILRRAHFEITVVRRLIVLVVLASPGSSTRGSSRTSCCSRRSAKRSRRCRTRCSTGRWFTAR